MSVKLISTDSGKITLQLEIDLDAQSLLNSEEQIQTVLNEAGKLATESAITQFDTDGSPIQVNNKNWHSKYSKKKSTKHLTEK